MVTAYQPSPGVSTVDRPKCAALRDNLKDLPRHLKGVSKVSIGVWELYGRRVASGQRWVL